MSSPPGIRRVDRLMSEENAREFLKQGFSGRLATVSNDGSPYCLPFLYVWLNERLFFHNTVARGHLRANVDHEPRVCFLVDEPDQVFDYGRFEWDTGLAYRSVLVFGTVEVIGDLSVKQQFFEALMAKYGTPDRDRPKGFFPRSRPHFLKRTLPTSQPDDAAAFYARVAGSSLESILHFVRGSLESAPFPALRLRSDRSLILQR